MVLVPDITKTNYHKSNRISGLDTDKLMRLLPVTAAQAATDVVKVLFEAIESRDFIACTVPAFEARLIEKAEARDRPGYRIFTMMPEKLDKYWRVRTGSGCDRQHVCDRR